MSFNTFLKAMDPEVLGQMGNRRTAIAEMMDFGRKAALAAVPVAAPVFSRRVRFVHDVYNFALTLEYLENEFYIQGLATDGLIPAEDRGTFEVIQAHEQAHVDALIGLIEAAGETPVAKPTFDFTAGGTFPTFTDYRTFALLAQGFEDTGVRAYKGQAPNLMENPDALTAALTIHSVEARHAAQVRRINGFQGWIPQDQPDIIAALAPVYAGEDNQTHAGVRVQDVANVSIQSATEAWDEPLTMEDVLAIAGQFIVE